MPNVIALIPTHLTTTVFGLPSLVAQPLAGRCVLEHTVKRVARIKRIQKIVLLHEPAEDPMGLLGHCDFGKTVIGFADPAGLTNRNLPRHVAGRKWAMDAWRGGLGGATCYDELLAAKPMLAAMERYKADAALLIGADWPLVDPGLCQQVLDLHLQHPEALQMTFTQAPPGLAGIIVSRDLLHQIAQNNVSFGQLLAYSPAKPQADPIGRDVCVQIPAAVRNCSHRFIFDTPASAAMTRWIAQQIGDSLPDTDAVAIADCLGELDDQTANTFARLPQQVTLELTPHRKVSGPITPQHYVQLDRPELPLEAAKKIVQQLGDDLDTVLTLGGLGDALLYEHWQEIVLTAKQAGVLGIAIETDLLVDQPVLEKLLELPIDVVSVRLNADTTATYKQVMDPDDTLNDGFKKVIENLQWLLNQRNHRDQQENADSSSAEGGRLGLPWVVPRLAKTADTLGDLETFFDRWVYFAGHAVIEPVTSACGLGPDLSPVRMSPPGRFACRQITRRMTIHCNGRVARCDQDWLGRAYAGDTTTTPLVDIWQQMQPLRDAHTAG